MKVLYAALRHDPANPVLSSSVDYGFYSAITSFTQDVSVFGPFPPQPSLLERALRKLYRSLTNKRYIKWDFHTIFTSARKLNKTVAAIQPDLVFSIFPASFITYRQDVPFVFTTDLTFEAWQRHGAGFGKLPFKFMDWVEHQAVTRCTRLIVHSQWGKDQMVKRHGINPDKVRILIMPAAIPSTSIPEKLNIRTQKELASPLRLLLVGRDYHRKGVDIAHEIVRLLNEEYEIPTELTICATDGPAALYSRYVGPFMKDDPVQLQQYVDLYKQAHFLIHPARFEPAGIVPGEAAAFGTPTLTNDTGGLATTVKDGVSGVVLSKASPAKAYANAVQQLINSPESYYTLCESTRKRYDEELNWTAATKQLKQIFEEVIEESGQNK